MANNDTICRTCLRLWQGLCDGEKEMTACLWYETDNYIGSKSEEGETDASKM